MRDLPIPIHMCRRITFRRLTEFPNSEIDIENQSHDVTQAVTNVSYDIENSFLSKEIKLHFASEPVTITL